MCQRSERNQPARRRHTEDQSIFSRVFGNETCTGKEALMPNKETIEKAKEDKREGKAASTQAGEFIREEMHRIRRGEHGARSPQQAIAIGLSAARG
jgi:hypothetical protein